MFSIGGFMFSLQIFIQEGDSMMKKLLILFVVLALAASASAADVYVDAESGGYNAVTVQQGATVVVDLVCNIDMTGIGDTDLGDEGWWVTADSGVTLPASGTFDDVLNSVTSSALTRLYLLIRMKKGRLMLAIHFSALA